MAEERPQFFQRDPGLAPPRPEFTEDDIWAPLQDLYGLAGPKAQARRFINFARVQKRRRELQFPCPHPLLHMCFTGEPGTGKTEFARRLSSVLYRADLVLREGLVEVSRKDLVDRYVGHTAQKTANILADARGKVLLIDEAYALVRERDDRRDFGHEALAVLIKALEDDRHEFVCILTGYDREMGDFLDVNTGLRSRIGFYLRFATYTPPELGAIGDLMAGRWGVTLAPGARDELRRTVEAVAAAGQLGRWGNARMVRHLVEKSVMEQADRLVLAGLLQASREDLAEIQPADMARAAAVHFGVAGGQDLAARLAQEAPAADGA